jgi:transcriptional regulator with XRE-family HTH domain
MFGKRVRELLATTGMSKEELAQRSGLPIETIRNIYYDKVSDPKVSTVLAIGNVFNISVNCLMGQCQHTPDERALLQYYRACGHHGKNIVRASAKYEALTAKEEREATGRHSVPCLFPEGDIYHGIDYDGARTEDIWVSNNEADTAIYMTTNCLMPTYCKGDTILITDRFPRVNEYGVFYYHSRAYIRQYIERDGEYILKCLHKFDKDLVFKRMDDIECLGTCCGVIRS